MSSYTRSFVVLLALTRVALAGSLAGSGQYTGAGHSLTALGNIDWAAWGDGGSGSIIPTNRKSGGGSLIGASLVGRIITFNNSTNTNGGLYWTDGSPTPSQLAPNGIETSDGTGGGYKLTFPASTTPHTVYLFLGGRNNFPTLTASLSDGSASVYTNNSLGAASAPFNVMFVLTYAANSSGQTLTVTYTQANGASDVTLDGAAYSTVAPASGGSISGSVTPQTTQTKSLTSLGATDWAEWGYTPGTNSATPSNTKNNGGNTISAQVIDSSVAQYSGAPVAVSWTNGTPNATGTETTGIYANSGDAGDGFLMKFPADTNWRTVSIICGGYINVGQLGVALTDGSAPEYLDASQSSSAGGFYAVYTITYKAASAGQSLLVSWVQLNTGNNVTLSGAAYTLNAAQCTSPCLAATTVSSPLGGSATSSPINTTGATLYVVTLSSDNNLGAAKITSSPPQTWTGLNYYYNAYHGTGNGVMYYVCGPTTSASQAITVTGAYATAVFAAYSGTAVSNCFDSPNQNGNSLYNGGGSFQPGSITPSQNGALIVSGLGANSSASSVSIDSGFTIVGTYAGNHFSSQAFQVQAAASAINPTWTESSDGNAVPYIATFFSSSHSDLPANVTAAAGTPQNAPVNTVFAAAPQALVKDSAGNPVSGATVTFSAPASGASATFGGSAIATVTTNASGVATAPALTASTKTGSYSVAAVVSGVSTPASFSLTNVAGTPAGISATLGAQQSTTVNTAFASAIQATVKDAYSNPVSGVSVSFTAPISGASASFSGSASATAMTNSSGVAAAPTLIANSQAGAYLVTANAAGATAGASFNLTNTAVATPTPTPAPGSISASAGTPQSTTVGTQFNTVLQALVKDNNGNPYNGAIVTFTAPGSGASAAFSGSASTTAITNASGIASTSALTANSQSGSYTVTASVAGVPTPANFVLTNTAAGGSSSASLVQQATGTNLGNNGNTLTVTLPQVPSASDVLVLIFDQTGTSQTITSITGATWTRVGQNTSAGDLEIWTGTNLNSSTITVTGANYFGLFQPGYAIVTEFSGITGSLDGAALTTAGGIWPVNTKAVTTTNAADLLLTAVLSYNGGGIGAAASSGWTLLTAPPGTYSLAAAFQSVNTTGSYAATWNGNGTPQAPSIILALKASGSSSGTSINATAGTPQSTTVSATFSSLLQATVMSGNNPVSGVSVTFTSPISGASASFSGSASATATTNSSGVATAPTLIANSQAGAYLVTANAAGATAGASFNLTNTAVATPTPTPAPGSISASAGTPQSTTVGTQFNTVLQALVKDNNGNPYNGAIVTFTAPGSGASAAFSGSASTTAITNASGIASTSALTANSQSGSYTVTASVAGVPTPANFVLTNTAAGGSSSASLVQQATGTNLGNNGNTLTVTLPQVPSASDVLVLIFDQTGTSQTITSITGATWTRVGQNTSAGDLEIWTGTNPSSSTITVTGANYFGVFQPGYAIVTEFSGITGSLDGAALTTAGGIWPVNTKAVTTTNAADLLLTAVLSYNGGGIGAAASSGWTLLAAPPGTYSLAAAFQSVNTTGSYAATWNGNGTPQAPSIIVALK